jgi:hypothetical protein
MAESGAPRAVGLRFVIVAAVLVALAVVALPVGLGALVPPACGCLSTPTHPPGWTPWPVSDDQAADTASRLAGVSVRTRTYEITLSGRPLIEAQGITAVAFVDANSGAVLATVIEDRLPDSGTTLASTEAARSAAEAFLAAGRISPTGLTEATELVKRASVAFYDVTWTSPDANKPRLEVLVNPASGAVFAYRDLGSGLELSIPVLGYKAAVRLVAASSYANGETPDPANQPQPDLMDPSLNAANGHDWSWDVSLSHRFVEVDAETGVLWTWN